MCNDFLLSKNLSTISIRHTVKLLRIVAIEEIKNKNLQYLIESLISRVENVTSIYQVKTINESGLLKKMEKIIR